MLTFTYKKITTIASYLTSFFYVFREGSAVAAGSSVSGPKADEAVAMSPSSIRVSGEWEGSGCPKDDEAVAMSPSIRKKNQKKKKKDRRQTMTTRHATKRTRSGRAY